MLAASLCVMIVAAAPAWKVEIDHREDVKDATSSPKKKSTLDTATNLKELFDLTVTEAGEARPKAVELAMVRGTLGKVTARDERGEAFVRFEHAPPDERLRQGMSRYFDRLVQDDEYRAAMSKCDAESSAATEKWLRKNLAQVLLSSLSDLTLDNTSIKCSKAKSGVVYDVAMGVTAPRGRSWVKLKLKGRVTVDPTVWATTWRLTGPLTMAVDMGAFGVPKMAGTFSSSFNLSRK